MPRLKPETKIKNDLNKNLRELKIIWSDLLLNFKLQNDQDDLRIARRYLFKAIKKLEPLSEKVSKAYEIGTFDKVIDINL